MYETTESPQTAPLRLSLRFDRVAGALGLAWLRLQLSRQTSHCCLVHSEPHTVEKNKTKKLQRITFLRRPLEPGIGSKQRDGLSQ